MSTFTVQQQDDINATGDRLFAAITAGDIDALRDLYAPDATVWHNFTTQEQTKEETLQIVSYIASHWSGFRFEGGRRWPIDDGFIQQHTIRVTGPDGTDYEAPSIILVRMRGGKVARIEEYFIPAQLPPFPAG